VVDHGVDPIQVMARQHDRGPRIGSGPQQAIELVAGIDIKAGMRLVKQPEFTPPCDKASERHTATLTSR
jgi:hypothetical protein